MQRVRRSLDCDAVATSSDCAVSVAGVERVLASGEVAEWSLSTPADLLGGAACGARPTDQRHTVGLHTTRRPAGRCQTPGSRRRNLLQVLQATSYFVVVNDSTY